jgi:Domain of unknown function (DU1801)
MPKNKTTQTQASVATFLEMIQDTKKRSDCATLTALIAQHTALEAVMWGTAIIGFGSYHYKYFSGHQGSAPLVGLAPRAAAIVLYLSADFENRDALLQKLGKHKTGVGCVYVKQLEDINTDILMLMIDQSIAYINALHHI